MQHVTYRQHHVSFTSLQVTDLCIRSHKYLYSMNADNKADTSHCKEIQAWNIIYNSFSSTCMSHIECLPPHAVLFLPGREEYSSPGTEGDIPQLELTVQSHPSPLRTSHALIHQLQPSDQRMLRKPGLLTTQIHTAKPHCQAGTELGLTTRTIICSLLHFPSESVRARTKDIKLCQLGHSILGRAQQVQPFQQYLLAEVLHTDKPVLGR